METEMGEEVGSIFSSYRLVLASGASPGSRRGQTGPRSDLNSTLLNVGRL